MVLVVYLIAFVAIAFGGFALAYAIRTNNQRLTLSTAAVPLLAGLLLCSALGFGLALSIQTAIICTAMYLVPVMYCTKKMGDRQSSTQ